MIDKNQNNIVEFDVSAGKLLNIAFKKTEKGNYINAIPILKKALAEDPENLEALLELAGIYSKINMVDKSNEYAYKAITLKHNETSLYVIGNNFIKMHNFDKAFTYYERLLEMYPNSSHSEHVSMLMEHMEGKDLKNKEMKLHRLTKKGREYIERGQYEKAIRLFTIINLLIPDELFVKNNLAMAYFYNKQMDKAIKTCKEVIMKKRYDVYANCNLSLIYYKIKNKYELGRQLEKLNRLKPATPDEFIKLICTYCEMNMHEEVIKAVKQATAVFSCDLTYMFFLAAANYNLGNVNRALSVYRDILKADENNYVAYYYIKSINSLMKPKSIDYYNQLPMVAVIDCVKRLRVLAEMPKEELSASWSDEDRMIVIWGTRYKDDGIKKLSFNILGSVGNAECEDALRSSLFSSSISDEVKKDILAALHFMGAPQPYAAYFAGDILDVKVSVATVENNKELERPHKAIGILRDCVLEELDEDMLKDCIDVYVMMLNEGLDSEFRSVNALCAVIEIAVREMHNIVYSKAEVAKRYRTKQETINKYEERLANILFDSDDERENELEELFGKMAMKEEDDEED